MPPTEWTDRSHELAALLSRVGLGDRAAFATPQHIGHQAVLQQDLACGLRVAKGGGGQRLGQRLGGQRRNGRHSRSGRCGRGHAAGNGHRLALKQIECELQEPLHHTDTSIRIKGIFTSLIGL